LPRRHTRAVLAFHGLGWWILDHVLGDGDAHIDLFWHVHPAWAVTPHGNNGVEFRQRSSGCALSAVERIAMLPSGADPLAVYSPAYGAIDPAPVLRVTAGATLPATLATFINVHDSATVEIERVPLERPPGSNWHGSAFRAEWGAGRMTLLAAIERTGVATDAAAAPGLAWGTSDVMTDARVAMLIEGADGALEGLLVNGTTVTGPLRDQRVTSPSLPAPLVRFRCGAGSESVRAAGAVLR
jgi:hypothetical protein